MSGTSTQGSKSLCESTVVYITNFTGFDSSQLVEYVGHSHDSMNSGIKIIYPKSMSGGMLKDDSASILRQFEGFRPGQDYLMIAGRAFTNFVIGALFGEAFYDQGVDLLLFDAKAESYYPQKWKVGE